MLTIFVFSFVLIFGIGYILFAYTVYIVGLSFVGLVLNGIIQLLGLENFFKSKNRKKEEAEEVIKVDLNNPIGALAAIANRYNALYFLQDLVSMEIKIFGACSDETAQLFYAAKKDPRPEVFGTNAAKILFGLAKSRQQLVNEKSWTEDQELVWCRAAPSEFRATIEQSMAA